MKTSILEQIQAIKSNNALNVRQKHAAILSIDIDGKRGAQEARAIQSAIKSKIDGVKRKYRLNRLGFNYSYISPKQRRSARQRKEEQSQLDQQNLMQQALDGYPKLCLGRHTTQVSFESIKGGYAGSHVRIGDWIISSMEDVSYDNNYYSKTWHRAHGGKKSVDARIVQIRKWTPEGIINKDSHISTWAGNWLINGLVNAGIVTPVKLPKSLKSVQLNTAFNVRLIRTVLGVSVYERTFADCHYDYCAVAGNVTFHGSSIRDCLKGLHKKTTEIKIAKETPINWDLCKSLGFCDTGIEEFCSDFGLDLKGNYSPEKINDIVKTDLSKASKYEQELKKVAQVLNYSISI